VAIRGSRPGLGQYHVENLGIAAITLGRIQQLVDALSQGDPRRVGLQSALSQLIGIARSNGRVEPFNLGASTVWARLLPLRLQRRNSSGADVELDDEDRMIAAIAIDRNLTLVEAQQPYHGTLSQHHSFTAFDPY
jgi:predicted nucleic acid-binding protein